MEQHCKYDSKGRQRACKWSVGRSMCLWICIICAPLPCMLANYTHARCAPLDWVPVTLPVDGIVSMLKNAAKPLPSPLPKMPICLVPFRPRVVSHLPHLPV